jgi:hypothetical protein
MNRGIATMHRSFLLALPVVGGFATAGAPALTYMMADQTQATETTTKKKKKKVVQKKKVVKKRTDYYGYPEEPNQAGMSDYCSYMYNIYHRRGVGCNRYGHDFMFDD